MNLNLHDKTAVICGGSSGIGKAIAVHLTAEGCEVLICSRSKYKLNLARKEILFHNPLAKIKILTVDLYKPEGIQHIEEYKKQNMPKVDILVNSLPTVFSKEGVYVNNHQTDLGNKCLDKLLAYINITRLFVHDMELNKYGRIIHIAGVTGKEPSQKVHGNLFMSGIVNAAIINFSKAIAAEYASSNVCSNVINPGYIVTERFDTYIKHTSELEEISSETLKRHITTSIPAKRLGLPEEVAYLCTFLASAYSGYITGQCVDVDGGYTRGIF